MLRASKRKLTDLPLDSLSVELIEASGLRGSNWKCLCWFNFAFGDPGQRDVEVNVYRIYEIAIIDARSNERMNRHCTDKSNGESFDFCVCSSPLKLPVIKLSAASYLNTEGYYRIGFLQV